jgi:hypothetical protein
MVLSTRARGGAQRAAPSGAMIIFRPPWRRIFNGTRTVTV